MSRDEVTRALFQLINKALSLQNIANHLQMRSVSVTSACFGNNSMPEAAATKLCDF